MMKDSSVRGSSYGGIRQYVAGEIQNPRPELLGAMAKVLGVREAWLMAGSGPMTEAEAARQEEVERIAEEGLKDVHDGQAAEDPKTPRARQKQALKDAILELVGEVGPSVDDIPFWVDPLVEVFKRAAQSDPLESSDEIDDDLIDMAAAIRGPLEALGVDLEAMRDRRGTVWADYVTAMTPALLAVAAERERQRWEEARAAARE